MSEKSADHNVFSKEKIKEAARLLRRIEWKVKKSSTHLFLGEYRSVFKGKGKEFDQVVAYEFGDDIRDIDWNVTARLGALYRKKFVEERELILTLVVEDSSSLLFGSGSLTKRDAIMEIAGYLSILATGFSHRLSIVHVFPGGYFFMPPMKGKKKILSSMVKLFSLDPPSLWPIKSTEIPWSFLYRTLPRNSVVFWLGDFPRRPISRDWIALSERFEIIGFRVEDPWEYALPEKERFLAYDPVAGKVVKVDTANLDTQKRQQKWRLEKENYWKSLFPKRFSRCSFMLGTPIYPKFMQFFIERSLA
ncbi:DUF58 domain-containing protein [Methylacidiphilum caldifontis]|uniref:DUF58 domain-containing protein n=1 Tax=Methylacidiphilum caldifontis TaxID=2795386 RepID=A0A4Y8P8A3_9BACT|nr:DUF58 domain-containing protein [Methylacidiphilum caldifontis]TFE66815.1 hypothetical protein A7Q10_10135 [Methylacidiphilum caldifontis]